MNTQTQTGENTPLIDLGAETAIGYWEWMLIAAVAVIALVYLLRKFTSKKPACASCGKEGSCGSADVIDQVRAGRDTSGGSRDFRGGG
ncbi:MAG: hypothetical protein MI741_20390 [Rhodospirillales bacterium]|nr:hypothetical protein [Rhodospirillales bacterium]